MFAILILIGLFVLGFCTSATLWRIVFGIGIVVWIGSSWARETSVADRVYVPDYVMEALGRELLISWSVSLGVYILGILLGAALRQKIANDQFEHFTSEEFVDAVDQGLASVIGTNHTWAQANWHSLDRQEKINWITKRRPFLSDITRTNSSAEIISVMQKADHRCKDQTAEK